MKLKQLKGKVSNACLICHCISVGNYIGELNDETFEKYNNCEVVSIGSGMYNRFGTEIWIRLTKRLQNNLCKNCSWDNCWENPNHPEFIKKLKD